VMHEIRPAQRLEIKQMLDKRNKRDKYLTCLSVIRQPRYCGAAELPTKNTIRALNIRIKYCLLEDARRPRCD
jgi:hypothetical protein